MKDKQVSPVVAVIIILAAAGVAFGIMLSITERKPPHLPSSMGQAMKDSSKGPATGNRGGPRSKATAPDSAGANKTASPPTGKSDSGKAETGDKKTGGE